MRREAGDNSGTPAETGPGMPGPVVNHPRWVRLYWSLHFPSGPQVRPRQQLQGVQAASNGPQHMYGQPCTQLATVLRHAASAVGTSQIDGEAQISTPGVHGCVYCLFAIGGGGDVGGGGGGGEAGAQGPSVAPFFNHRFLACLETVLVEPSTQMSRLPDFFDFPAASSIPPARPTTPRAAASTTIAPRRLPRSAK